MKFKVSEASGPALNWMVAKALGKRPSMFIFQQTGKMAAEHNYTTDPAQGDLIIDRDGIATSRQDDDHGNKYSGKARWWAQMNCRVHTAYGPTRLIAAMRCYVVSKLGEEVEVPDELV